MYNCVNKDRSLRYLCTQDDVWAYYISNGSNRPALETHFIRGNSNVIYAHRHQVECAGDIGHENIVFL